MTSRKLVVYGYETSNNMKVLAALGHKGLPYEFRAIDPADRSEIIRISGQFLTPVLIDGTTVLFDSSAIMRYLDANFPDTPKLYGSSSDEQWEIEDWERFGRGSLAEPMMDVVHASRSGREVSPGMLADAGQAFERALHRLEARLDGRRFIVGDALSAADITCAAVIRRLRQRAVLPFPEDCPLSVELSERVMSVLD